MLYRHIVLAALSALLVSCASSSHPAPSTSSSTPASTSSDQSRLTSAEIVAANLPTAYDLVERLRRPWLRHDPMTGGDVVVYQDNQNLGNADKLRDIPAVNVSAMQFLANAEAVRRYGNDIKGGVIIVVVRR